MALTPLSQEIEKLKAFLETEDARRMQRGAIQIRHSIPFVIFPQEGKRFTMCSYRFGPNGLVHNYTDERGHAQWRSATPEEVAAACLAYGVSDVVGTLVKEFWKCMAGASLFLHR